MKNKQKAWRRDAEQINYEASQKRGERTRHQGRAHKVQFQIPTQPVGLLKALLVRAGIVTNLAI